MDYDFIVIGGGTGNKVASYAASKNNKVALFEPGPIGGTCMNRGCNPSKMLIHHANILDTIKNSDRFHIKADIENVDFSSITKETEKTFSKISEQMTEEKKKTPNLDLYKTRTKFIDNHEIEINGNKITGEKIIIAAGSRPIVPSVIDGLNDTDYLTSAEAMFLNEKPENLIILGGGYIAAELGYFFELAGTEVTLIEMEENLLPNEDEEISEKFTKIAKNRHNVLTNHKIIEVSQNGEKFTVKAENSEEKLVEIVGDEILVALGRRPNSDTLNLQATNVETDDSGFIKTNEYLETTGEKIWSFGDIADNFMFKHSADYEAKIVKKNAIDGEKIKTDFKGMPRAIFTKPQIGAVGKKEKELEKEGIDFNVAYAEFKNTPLGKARKNKAEFAKILVNPDNEKILGAHILGPEASVLIHEISLVIRNDLSLKEISNTIHVHPTLNKIFEEAIDQDKKF